MLRRNSAYAQPAYESSLFVGIVQSFRFSHTRSLVYSKKYSTEGDQTLTPSQAKSGKFSNALDSLSGSFRSPSNKTLARHRTGYHEPLLTTDAVKQFQKDLSLIAEDKASKSATLQPNRKSSFFQFKDHLYYPETLKYYKQTADGFRVDTARTALSAPGGHVAGHSGSGMRLTRQADAHNALRETLMDTLRKNPNRESGITTKSIACIQGAVTIASMAPGELTRTIPGSLKDKSAGRDWEERRNEAKRRLDVVMDTLTPTERQFVISITKRYFQRIQLQDNITRYLAPKRARSPLRTNTLPSKAKISGGDYIKESKKVPTILPPDDPSLLGHYFTEPFKAARRKLLSDDV